MEQYIRIVDAHSHLWLRQDTLVDGAPVRTLDGNSSRSNFLGTEVQMLPPFMTDGRNSAEVFLSNMDYAQVSAAVVVQEIIDGNQDGYLAEVQGKYPDRFLCCGLIDGQATRPRPDRRFKAFAMPGHRIRKSLLDFIPLFKEMESRGQILSMCLADDERQIGEMQEVVDECPGLKIAIGHFGMVTTPSWKSQILLARNDNVMVESGGITWLYNSEFYPYPSAVRSIREAADMVGMDKLMWGSDYPRTITAITYRMSYDFILKSDQLTPEEKEKFLSDNARNFYGFKELKTLPYIKNMSE
ncbi:MAG: amidohydrolase [Bacteroidaceae bacterium]|nr:amidohydrolase [Bacteroidaceae bacterium]